MIDTDLIRNQIQAKVIADSISPTGVRLSTLEVKFHRFVLAEFNTHRVFSRNSASSRAIPVEKTLENFFLTGGMAFPISWPVEKPGMQGGAELEGADLQIAQELLEDIAAYTLERISAYTKIVPKEHRLHKSVLNRPMEWFGWHTVIVTSTEWDNFFDLRCNRLAQPELQVAAEAMRDVLAKSKPTPRNYFQWHTPYVDAAETLDLEYQGIDPLKVSVGRCARVSVLTHDGERDPIEDVNLCDRLANPGEGPPHASPFEHVATPAPGSTPPLGNFKEWDQYRHMLTF